MHDLSNVTLGRPEAGLALFTFLDVVEIRAYHVRELAQPLLLEMLEARNLARFQRAEVIWRMRLPKEMLILFQSFQVLELRVLVNLHLHPLL